MIKCQIISIDHKDNYTLNFKLINNKIYLFFYFLIIIEE